MHEWNRTVWTARMLVTAAWTVCCVLLGLAWMWGVAVAPEPADHRVVAVVIAGGCSGMCWTLGLVPILLVAALIRRSE